MTEMDVYVDMFNFEARGEIFLASAGERFGLTPGAVRRLAFYVRQGVENFTVRRDILGVLMESSKKTVGEIKGAIEDALGPTNVAAISMRGLAAEVAARRKVEPEPWGEP